MPVKRVTNDLCDSSVGRSTVNLIHLVVAAIHTNEASEIASSTWCDNNCLCHGARLQPLCGRMVSAYHGAAYAVTEATLLCFGCSGAATSLRLVSLTKNTSGGWIKKQTFWSSSISSSWIQWSSEFNLGLPSLSVGRLYVWYLWRINRYHQPWLLLGWQQQIVVKFFLQI